MEKFLNEGIRRHSFLPDRRSTKVTKLDEWNEDDTSIDKAEVNETITTV